MNLKGPSIEKLIEKLSNGGHSFTIEHGYWTGGYWRVSVDGGTLVFGESLRQALEAALEET